MIFLVRNGGTSSPTRTPTSPPTCTSCPIRPWPCVEPKNWLSLCSVYPIVSFYFKSNLWIICRLPSKILSWINGFWWRKTPWFSCSTIKTFLPTFFIKVSMGLNMNRIGSKNTGNYFLLILKGKLSFLFYFIFWHFLKYFSVIFPFFDIFF